ncbi:MAG: 50S ribosomal protein L25 [Planctomycetes bacterium]|jgi:large subunit ribosomal protein L25|nr:50S ribosomal protein L25 [Planctomycetota bacterium]
MQTLKAVAREGRGSRLSRHLRQKGMVPAIIYGHKVEPRAVALGGHDLELALHASRLLALDVEGHTENVLIKDVQYDAFGTKLLHVDFARVNLDERVSVTVPIILRGKPTEVGAVLTQVTNDLEIECLVTSIPDEIRIPVGEMKIGDVIKAKDVPLPQGAALLVEEDVLICTVSVVAEEAEAPAAEAGAAEPEVIGEKKEEAEEEEAK